MLARFAQSTALTGIWAYQRGVSPFKSYSCTYRVLHASTGCSGYAKSQIRHVGVLASTPTIRARFAAYKTAVYKTQATHLKTVQAATVPAQDAPLVGPAIKTAHVYVARRNVTLEQIQFPPPLG